MELFVKGLRHEGMTQRLRNGPFDFITRLHISSEATLIKKVAQGRLSATKDGAMQLTLKTRKVPTMISCSGLKDLSFKKWTPT